MMLFSEESRPGSSLNGGTKVGQAGAAQIVRPLAAALVDAEAGVGVGRGGRRLGRLSISKRNGRASWVKLRSAPGADALGESVEGPVGRVCG